ncbi:MAG TPA: two-component system response regulator KdpE [Zoogloea sp.]|nr:two-component system response regulator KdpE [Zoogloea sp.]HOB46032.1 two-component system response regulator KdpE [Zoogloea sp.]HQE37966.1 two-component system response regulator KdpE [Zoogloea sp.]
MSAASGPTILIVEDECQIRRFVRTALEREGMRVGEAGTRRDGLIEAGRCKPDLVVLDLGLPDGDGAQFVEDFRAWSSAPVLVLSARSTENDKIGVLDAGADDYLTKPFSVGELLARVRALLRRGRNGAEAEAALVAFGDVEVDFSRRQVTRGGELVKLTPIEYRLLGVLIANAGKVLTHRHLLREIWGPAYSDSSHYLRIYVGHLRHKLEDDPAQPRHFLTETGVGYRFQL